MKRYESTKEHYLALLFITLAVLFWGYSFISTKTVLTQIPPISIAFFRQIIATFVLFPLALHTRCMPKLALHDLILAAGAGFFGIVMYFVFENSGLQYTTASNASMIVSALPIFTLISEAIFFRLSVNWKMIFCLAISIIGVSLVVTVGGRFDFASTRLFGNMLVLCAMICWVIYNIINRKLDKKYPSITITAYQSVSSVFLYVPFVLSERTSWNDLGVLSAQTLENLFFLGIFCSALAYFFYVYAAKRLGITISSTFLNLVPVITTIFGYIVLQERLIPMQILGIGLIIASIFELNRIMPRPSTEIISVKAAR